MKKVTFPSNASFKQEVIIKNGVYFSLHLNSASVALPFLNPHKEVL